MAIIEVTELGKTFRSKRKDPGLRGSLKALVQPEYRVSEAVKGISLTCERGEMLAFIGPNGAGKSTTIKMLTGILHPSSGSAQVLGLIPWRDRERLAFNIASVFGQKSQLWIHLPPLDTFNLLARIYELDERAYRERRDQLIELFEVGDLVRTPARRLSLGERMRCEIVAALIHRPQVLFLDEPTIGLDVVSKSRIRDLIRALNRDEGVTVFLTSHDAGDIEQLCKRVIVINHGTLILNTSVSQLKRRYLQHKIVSLKLHQPVPTAGLDLPGTTVLKTSTYGVKLQVDTAAVGIETVIGRLVGQYAVADITIEDPPLEDIIAAIYGQPAQSGGPT
ncbi:MAG: ATP-binding cassette domain-containing protein [Chloroflexota bacterium]|nr:ATP-binding cassette domain-containing protein [Chloroflexota bacterium]